MTRTEERLRDYFGAVANSVGPGSTAPLAPPRPRKRPRRAKAAFRHRGWQTWGVPLAAGASVLAVASLSVAVAGLSAGHQPAPSSGASDATGRPQYYAEVDGSATGGSVAIRSTSSGAVVSSVQRSALLRASGLPAQPSGVLMAVAAAPDDRTFYAEMLTNVNQAWIFSFRVNGSGPVTGITRIRGGVVQGGYAAGLSSLTVSPDGERLALTATSSASVVEGGHVNSVQDKIVVVDLRAGTQRTWQGGLYSTGKAFDIESLSWSDNGQSLVFVPAWCPPTTVNEGLSCPYFVGGDAYSQVRLLRVNGSGTSLADSQVLLGASHSVQQAVSDQDGHFDVLNMSGPENKQHRPMTVTVEQFSATSGALERVLYRHDYQGASYADGLVRIYLAADPSGRYLLLGLEFNVSGIRNKVGWIDDNSLHALKVGNEDAVIGPDAW